MRLVSKEDVTEGIGTLFLAVTTGCNLRCVHCSADARAGGTCEHMSKEVYEEILRQAPSIGATHIVLSGGEPTLHPGITEMTRAALRQGHSVAISTNGTTRVRALMDLLEENADRALV